MYKKQENLLIIACAVVAFIMLITIFVQYIL
ncbi:Uncharacterised protein [Kurthia zopfii]|nr:Uncharacterised protein [Kurthia zopfii]